VSASPPCAWGKRPPTAPAHRRRQSGRRRNTIPTGLRDSGVQVSAGQGNGSATIKMSEDFSSGAPTVVWAILTSEASRRAHHCLNRLAPRISRRSMDWRTRRHWSSSIQAALERPSDSKLRGDRSICAHAATAFSAANPTVKEIPDCDEGSSTSMIRRSSPRINPSSGTFRCALG